MNSAWTRSPQSVDPLSWFTGPLVPVVFGGLTVTYGTAESLLSSRMATTLWLQWPALVCMLVAFTLISTLTQPRRSEFTARRAGIPLVLGWLGLLLSGLGYADGGQHIELWWAPIGLGFIVVALAPYSSSIRMIVAGTLSFLVTLGVVIFAFLPTASYWPPLTYVVLGAGTVAVATAASAVFSYQVVWRVTQWASSDAESRLSSGVLGEAAKLRILRQELASVSDRALPLLQRVAAAGVVTAKDREQAADLAEALRAELVDRSNRSWLDTLAKGMKLTVVDPEYRADRMTPPQRSALLGLLRAASDGSIKGSALLAIELRGEPDGSTAVAISIDVQLPEGRRVMLLAPHYLMLKATVDGLHRDSGEQLRMRFRLPPEA